MDYLRLTISITDEYQEILIAELFDMDFDGFEEKEENILIATIPTNRFDDSKRESIEKILYTISQGSRILTEEIIHPQNWNEAWERSIVPQTIGKFYVRPTWGEKMDTDDHIELIIDPKMAFGTGYHATTRLLLEWLPEVISLNDTVLDAGTGTGILALGALKLGAVSAFGFDIDEWSEDNARENMVLNQIENLEVKLGSVDTIPMGAQYDVIVANINRNALLELIPILTNYLKEDGKMLLSGLLVEDESKIKSITKKEHLLHVGTRQEQEWIAMLLHK
jgi:ribosomal protein L11 methyltransferase